MTHPVLRYRDDHGNRERLMDRFRSVRAHTEYLASFLTAEDMVIQAMPDASPTKWHLAHVTWFFEEFVLPRLIDNYKPLEPTYQYLYNSYYESVGERWARPHRGLLSRPNVDEVLFYRQAINERLCEAAEHVSERDWEAIAPVVELGLHHEEQHQELLVTDIKYAMSLNPTPFAIFPDPMDDGVDGRGPSERRHEAASGWIELPPGLNAFGADGSHFVYDNELPRHRRFQYAAALSLAPITNGDYIDFINGHGYERPEYWLSDGWAFIQNNGIRAPLYWREIDGDWFVYTAHGLKTLDPNEIVCHICAYEAHAYAAFAGCRLPTEFELEALADLSNTSDACLMAPGQRLHPGTVRDRDTRLQHVFGSVWEWTSSSYSPYPGFNVPAGPVGEYNGKFMSGQVVLKGGSCATPRDHIRSTYRNFFPPDARWQFTGLRLAKDLT